MNTDRVFKNERLRASEYAERLHPDNPEARQTAFEARYEHEVKNALAPLYEVLEKK